MLQRVYCVLFGLCTVGDCHSKRQLAEKWAQGGAKDQTKPNKTGSAGPRLSSPMPRMLSSGKQVRGLLLGRGLKFLRPGQYILSI